MTSPAEETFQYILDGLLRRNESEEQLDWFNRMRAAYRRQGFLSPRQVGVLATMANGDFTKDDLYEIFTAGKEVQ